MDGIWLSRLIYDAGCIKDDRICNIVLSIQDDHYTQLLMMSDWMATSISNALISTNDNCLQYFKIVQTVSSI